MGLINYVTRIQFASRAIETLKDEAALAGITCPSSYKMGHQSGLIIGGSGSVV